MKTKNQSVEQREYAAIERFELREYIAYGKRATKKWNAAFKAADINGEVKLRQRSADLTVTLKSLSDVQVENLLAYLREHSEVEEVEIADEDIPWDGSDSKPEMKKQKSTTKKCDECNKRISADVAVLAVHRVVGDGIDTEGGPLETYCPSCAADKIYRLRGIISDLYNGRIDGAADDSDIPF